MFGKDCQVQYEPKPLSSELIEKLDKLSLLGETQKEAHFFTCRKNAQISAYALIDSEVGKHLPITYIVGITNAGQVSRVEIMVFREEIGWEVRERGFLQQFENKQVSDKLKLGDTIRNISGATISSRSLTKGVKRALFLWQNFYGSAN